MELKDLQLVDIRQLPHSLQVLVSCVGLESAYRLTCEYGGRPKYIPKYAQRTSLSLILPPDALDALIENYAGTVLEIPKADHFCRQIRNQHIQMESGGGISRSVLAEKYGLSLRQIANIKRL
ncbi:transcriptional regulator [Pseudomonas viridiflava]|uniref:transcriptional regulator n=1 Tax=Pseudomonas viridiflava TaxID=33069 RepID=UPI000F022581|nr:transcriptional regulator [Pseudomonas viridiflava]MEE3916534.1 transcriptional regulator [Pseudomonas viridiflava]MEE3926969.1 transcriptional regulator [Pseudomonas viridiflava]MEE3929063.1 transcriptional regulator [Pseudomonas viridiflava]MEE3942154.1 transcriptional regulator [Pseudomonas viridiflava]MEE3969933.1 transcriptional regulator [Pseudomonas viridiflava]